METVTTLPRSRPLTVADMETMPDDGHRYELIDGTLLVSPAPVPRHQRVALMTWRLLDDAAPAELWVLAAPLDVILADDTLVQPDVLIARRDAFSAKNLPAAPLLAVEVLSPSTRLIDLNLKRARYERAGIASFWVIDPDELRLTAWELRDGCYQQVADVVGEESWHAVLPFDVAIRPAALLD